MCGITGFIANERAPAESLGILQRITQSLAHRGPDSDGTWQSADGRVNFGHRRLAIIDLTHSGHQPMSSPDGGHVITYNGEIYNYLELREDLIKSGVSFRGGSDTEVLLQALITWGVEPTLRRLNGMFAFAYWNGAERELWLARDRFGEKPLYYSWQNGVFIFGSELKALTAHPAFQREIDADAVALYLRFNYVPWPQTIYRQTRKLGPGHFLRVEPGCEPSAPQPYWSLRELVDSREPVLLKPNDPAITDAVDEALRKAVKMRMVSDVPLGAFLSGGIDSSLIVAMMQLQSSRPVKTFTIGFWETPYNEAEDAARIARHLGTEHHELYLSSRECIDLIARLPTIYDEPFADSSQIPTTLVSEFTRRHVTVALSGDAGDELFGGYNRYFWSQRIWSKLIKIPLSMRGRMAAGVLARSPVEWDRMFGFANPLVPAKFRVRGGGDKLHKLARAMDARSPDELYRGFVSQWHAPSEILVRGTEPPFLQEHLEKTPRSLDFVERMMYLDTLTYLPSDILCKVDRASMSASLEARVPFLDVEVARLAWNLPINTKIYRGIGKWPLRQVLGRYVPAAMFERPKMGFGIPIGDWLRGPLRDWTESMLNEQNLKDGGHFDAAIVRRQWAEHLSGRRNNQHTLWSVLMFQAWNRNWS